VLGGQGRKLENQQAVFRIRARDLIRGEPKVNGKLTKLLGPKKNLPAAVRKGEGEKVLTCLRKNTGGRNAST